MPEGKVIAECGLRIADLKRQISCRDNFEFQIAKLGIRPKGGSPQDKLGTHPKGGSPKDNFNLQQMKRSSYTL